MTSIANKISNVEIDAFIASCHSPCPWVTRDNKLCTSLSFPTFKEAFAFMTSIALYAESRNHHPEWSNVYNRLEIALSTHDAGGITQKDIDLAAYISRSYSRYAISGETS
jgi:4a-hydroxytetrahydrobiopterin dehydratase